MNNMIKVGLLILLLFLLKTNQESNNNIKKPHSMFLFVAEKDGSSNDSPRMDEGVYLARYNCTVHESQLR